MVIIMAKKTPNTTETVAEVPAVVAATEEQLTTNTEVMAAAEVHVVKADLGRTIFAEELAKGPLVRKDVIARLVGEAGLTKAGAATYYQNMKKKAGLVVARVAAAPAEGAAEVVDGGEGEGVADAA